MIYPRPGLLPLVLYYLRLVLQDLRVELRITSRPALVVPKGCIQISPDCVCGELKGFGSLISCTSHSSGLIIHPSEI